MDDEATKRIPKSLGTDTKLLGQYTMTDLAVALFPGVLTVLILQLVLPTKATVFGYQIDSLTLPIAGVMIALGAIFVYLTPAYTTSIDWVTSMLTFHRRSDQLGHEEATEYTQIERVYPDRGAIERTDGAVIGMVQVIPPTMALATSEEWATKAEAFQDFLNTTVEFPIQIYSTTQPFPVDEHLAQYESRLDDPDVEANPRLESLIENYVQWYEAELEERRMTIRDHYVVVPVTPAEVQFDETSIAQKLAEVPILGLFIRELYAPRKAVERAALIDELDDRLSRVQSGLRSIDGCTAHRIDATEATKIVGEYWSDESQNYGQLDQVLRTRGIVRGGEA
ncbi:hypothetical protein [Halosimplex sp. TS25]|uniref:hypothetical protein n=1 Tax=Halosimplex rarum TaxID=3396619 RepID=UPI0039EBB6EE